MSKLITAGRSQHAAAFNSYMYSLSYISWLQPAAGYGGCSQSPLIMSPYQYYSYCISTLRNVCVTPSTFRVKSPSPYSFSFFSQSNNTLHSIPTLSGGYSLSLSLNSPFIRVTVLGQSTVATQYFTRQSSPSSDSIGEVTRLDLSSCGV